MNQDDRIRVQIATAVISRLAPYIPRYTSDRSREEWSDVMAEDALAITDAMVVRLRPKPRRQTETEDSNDA